MKDPRGVERGACKLCECSAYELETGATRAACSYCECPATNHEALPAKGGNESGTNLSETSSFNSVTTPPAGSSTPVNVVTLDVSNVTDPFLQSLLTNSSSTNNEPNTDEIFIPEQLPKKYHECLASRDLDHNAKAGIVREIYSNLFSHRQTDNLSLKKAAKKMVSKWSPLKDPNDPTNEGLQLMLRKRRDRLNGGKSILKENSAVDSVMSASDAKKEMLEKWTRNERSTAAHLSLMEIARPLRKLDVKKLPALQLLRAYPALGLNDVLLAEFLVAAGVSYENATDRWRNVLKPLINHFKTNQVPTIEGTFEEETLSVLESLHTASKLWFKEKNLTERKARLLEIFPESTPVGEVQPKAKEAPRFIGIGSYADGSLSITCFVDSEPWFVESDPVKALFLLLAVYFVADLKWPTLTRLPLLFLTCATVGISLVRTEIVRNQKFIDFLKKMKAY